MFTRIFLFSFIAYVGVALKSDLERQVGKHGVRLARQHSKEKAVGESEQKVAQEEEGDGRGCSDDMNEDGSDCGSTAGSASDGYGDEDCDVECQELEQRVAQEEEGDGRGCSDDMNEDGSDCGSTAGSASDGYGDEDCDVECQDLEKQVGIHRVNLLRFQQHSKERAVGEAHHQHDFGGYEYGEKAVGEGSHELLGSENWVIALLAIIGVFSLIYHGAKFARKQCTPHPSFTRIEEEC